MFQVIFYYLSSSRMIEKYYHLLHAWRPTLKGYQVDKPLEILQRKI